MNRLSAFVNACLQDLTPLLFFATCLFTSIAEGQSVNEGERPVMQHEVFVRERNLTELAAEYKARSERLHKIAASLAGGFVHIGTAYSVVDSERHQCHALATLLGKDSIARRVAINYRLNVELKTIENAQDVAIAAHSMHVFTEVVREVNAWDKGQRQEEWNLGCVGSHQIGTVEFVGQPKPSFFRLRANGTVLIVLGDVETGFSNKLKTAVDANPRVQTILLGSGGGSVYEALMAGRYLRQRGLNTELWNNCLSACVLVFLGGVERRINAPYPTLGFHQISVMGNAGRPVAVSSTDKAYADVAAYAIKMGVDAIALLRLMQLRPPEGMFQIKYDHSDASRLLCKSKIATVVQRGCASSDR